MIGGTTGEGHLMDSDTLITLISYTVKMYADKIIIIGNTGSNITSKMIYLTNHGFEAGMHASLQVNPYYGKTSNLGLIAHFQYALNLGPSIIYNVPSRTAQDITPDVITEIYDHINFIGIKECAGLDRIKKYAQKNIAVWTGNDNESIECKKNGGLGVISIVSNIMPSLMQKITSSTNDIDDAILNPLFELFNLATNPIVINTIMSMSGFCKPIFKLPYVPVAKDDRIKIYHILDKYLKYDNFSDNLSILEDKDFNIILA